MFDNDFIVDLNCEYKNPMATEENTSKPNEWIHPLTITGGTPEGERYFPRTKVEEKLWREITKGNHVLFSAPRRVGKSSVMKFIATNPKPGYQCVYQNISSDNTAQGFYRRIFELVLEQAKVPKTTKLKEFFKGIGLEEISLQGLKFSQKDLDFKAKLLELLPNLKEEGLKVVLLLDEFPDVIRNVAAKEGTEFAKDILQTMREMRQNNHFRGHFSLVLAGTIGLDHVVKEIDRSAVTNDLKRQQLDSLQHTEAEAGSQTEAERFIHHVLGKATMQVSQECRKHMLAKLQNPIPYYIQLMIEACNDLLYDSGRIELTKSDVDKAWETILSEHSYFSDWDERLREYFPEEYSFFHAVLSNCADKGNLSIQELFNLAVKAKLQTEYKALVDDVLIKDGYLQQDDNQFQFVSPLLQAWWKRRHPNIKPERK